MVSLWLQYQSPNYISRTKISCSSDGRSPIVCRTRTPMIRFDNHFIRHLMGILNIRFCSYNNKKQQSPSTSGLASATSHLSIIPSADHLDTRSVCDLFFLFSFYYSYDFEDAIIIKCRSFDVVELRPDGGFHERSADEQRPVPMTTRLTLLDLNDRSSLWMFCDPRFIDY